MMISTKGRYALRVMVDLAEHRDAAYVPLKEIAERQQISEKYLESILKVLVREELLQGLRGKGGGYRLTRAPEDYSVGSILRLSAPEDFEVTYQAPGDGLRLELHKALFAPDSEVMGDYNRFFDGAMERAVTVRAEGADLRTLCPHDHLLYLLLHAMKHFIHSGFGIRQVLDIGLFAGRYGAGVDWPRLLRQCREVRGEQFAAAVFDTARRLGLEVPLDADWEALAGDGGPLLRDLLSGGVYGATDRSRLHSGTVTLHAVEAQRRGGGSSLLRTLFPGRAGLEGRYPYLKRYPALLPVAWVQRLWRYGREAGRPGGGASESLKTANRRLALLREYGILD